MKMELPVLFLVAMLFQIFLVFKWVAMENFKCIPNSRETKGD